MKPGSVHQGGLSNAGCFVQILPICALLRKPLKLLPRNVPIGGYARASSLVGGHVT
jgi:hypothetical protein